MPSSKCATKPALAVMLQSVLSKCCGSRMSEALYANESGSAMMRLNSIMHSPDKDAFEHHLAVGKAQSKWTES